MDCKTLNPKNNYYMYPILTFVLCLSSLVLLGRTGAFMRTSIGELWFLSLHTLFEFVSILFSFAIFTLVFYIYKQNSNLRYLMLASVFFICGFLDIFHTLSYKGMPDFFAANGASIPTLYWVAARFIMAAGFLWAVFIKPDKKTGISRWIVLAISLSVSFLLFYLVTYNSDILPRVYIEGQGLTPLKIQAEYAIIAMQTLAVALSIREFKQTGSRASILFATALIINIFSELCFTLYISVFDMYNFSGHIFKIIAYSIMFNILFIHNIRLPYERLEKADVLLKRHAGTLEQEVENAKLKLMETNRQLYKDIKYAREIQQSMLPERKLDYPGMEFYTALVPCENLSGDFYNVFRIDEENVGFYLVDVSGHGISSAIITIFTDRTILTNKLDTYKQQLLLSPSKVLADLYQLYNNSRFPDEMYLLIFYGVYNSRTREFTYSSAGLNTHPIVMSGGKVHTLVSDDTFPICKMGDYIQPAYTDNKLQLKPGDRILMYSDGLVEAVNREGAAFSTQRLMSILEGSSQLTAQDLYYEIYDRFSCFVLDKELEDDVTVMLVNTL